jgi:hypothetical protein
MKSNFLLEEVSNNKTEFIIDIQRVIGAFDSWVEVQNANNHINNIINVISESLNDPNLDLSQPIQNQQIQQEVPVLNKIIASLTMIILISLFFLWLIGFKF